MIDIYDVEKSDGLEEKILGADKISYATLLVPTNLSDSEKSSISQLIAKATNKDQFDLHYLKTVLVTTGWNKNDDVFLVDEVFASRNTPEDKPFNYEHNEKDIIGHITDNYVIDDSGKVISSEKDLPNKIHIVTNAVLYKSWSDKELAERMESIIKEIGEGKWFVSMEALFPTFDYAVIDKSGAQKILKRNKETASLTKHLRIYGGSGEYDGYKLGRVLRNITFCGKGLVKKPANPDSIIFTEASLLKFDTKTVLSSAASLKEKEGDNKMSLTLEDSIKQNAELTKKLDEALARLRLVDEEKIKADMDRVKAEIASRDEKINKLNESVATAEKAKSDLEKVQEETSKKLAQAVEDLSKIRAEQLKMSRIQALKNAGMNDEQAVAEFEKFASVDDKVFESVVKLAQSAYGMDKEKMKMEEEKKKKEKDKNKAAEETVKNLEETDKVSDLSTASDPQDDEQKKTVASLVSFFEENIFKNTKKKS